MDSSSTNTDITFFSLAITTPFVARIPKEIPPWQLFSTTKFSSMDLGNSCQSMVYLQKLARRVEGCEWVLRAAHLTKVCHFLGFYFFGFRVIHFLSLIFDHFFDLDATIEFSPEQVRKLIKTWRICYKAEILKITLQVDPKEPRWFMSSRSRDQRRSFRSHCLSMTIMTRTPVSASNHLRRLHFKVFWAQPYEGS